MTSKTLESFNGIVLDDIRAGAQFAAEDTHLNLAEFVRPFPVPCRDMPMDVAYRTKTVFKNRIKFYDNSGRLRKFEFFHAEYVPDMCDDILPVLLEAYQKFHQIPKEVREHYLRGR